MIRQMSLQNQKLMKYKQLEKSILKCTKCEISKHIHNKVIWEWSLDAKIMFIWEAPWRKEDLTWRPFVWPAWKILNNLIEKILGFNREQVYITSVLKCRPPFNRDPLEEEINNCYPFLEEQINIINPDILVALWRFAAKVLLWKSLSMKDLRWKIFKSSKLWKLIFVSYHPAAAIYNKSLLSVLEEDFKKLKKFLDNE